MKREENLEVQNLAFFCVVDLLFYRKQLPRCLLAKRPRVHLVKGGCPRADYRAIEATLGFVEGDAGHIFGVRSREFFGAKNAEMGDLHGLKDHRVLQVVLAWEVL